MQPHTDRTYEQLSPVILGKQRLVLWHPSLLGDFCAGKWDSLQKPRTGGGTPPLRLPEGCVPGGALLPLSLLPPLARRLWHGDGAAEQGEQRRSLMCKKESTRKISREGGARESTPSSCSGTPQ